MTRATRWLADAAWLGEDGLAERVLIETVDGRFTSVVPGASEPGAVRLRGIAMPGLVNAHSHAFHRLLRGRTHRRGGDFWVWRERMYETARDLTPDGYEKIATAVFIEMAMAGITTVGEFHYLHHQAGGVPYRDPNEMGNALIRAARSAGIRICLLDAGYFRAGFGNSGLSRVQERFRDPAPMAWIERARALASAHVASPDVRVGLAPHSVRAVTPETLRLVAAERGEVEPVHIHVSEQPAENTECLEATGMTPTALLSESGVLGPRTTLVHATHLTDEDILAIGGSRSLVCYCATTERDLADGIGPSGALASAGATLCVGSDSHAVIDLFEEGRGVELHHRLATGRRGAHSAKELASAMTVNGAAALGFDTGSFRVGAAADFIVIDTDNPRLEGMVAATGLDSVLFAATSADVRHVFVSGRQIVSNGVHEGWASAKDALTPAG